MNTRTFSDLESKHSGARCSSITAPLYSPNTPLKQNQQRKVKHLSLLSAVLALSTTCKYSCSTWTDLPVRLQAKSVKQAHPQAPLPANNIRNTSMSPSGQQAHLHTEYLETCIRHRHSIRYFKPNPVPGDLLHYCLTLAQLAPSNSNIQNWRITFALFAARDRIINALYTEAQHSDPVIPPIPEKYNHFRSELGHALYGKEGYDIPREDREAQRKASMRNFRFFDAPLVGVITMDKDLQMSDALSVGMFVQTFLLALTEQGLGACLQVAVTGYPEVLRREFGLGDDQEILCGIAVGYPTEHSKVNKLVMCREDIWNGVTVLEE